ncbi:MAG: TonB-dependent receptor [Sediminibacterium sp.]|nr:MAG: TonB-dependent receptor [Sediminibacterium sp.] [Sediminibacterium sp. FEMGT703S]
MKKFIFGNKGIILLLFTFLTAHCVFAQKSSISGKVIDVKGAVIAGASVKLKDAKIGVVSNDEGKFTLSVNASTNTTIIVSYVGYDDQSLVVADFAKELVVVLKEAGSTLSSVVVTANNSRRSQMEMPISVTTFSASKIASLRFNSNADILRVVPGITAEGGGGDVAANIFVRGLPSGGQYQFTPLQIDGMPVVGTMGLNSSAPDVYFRNDLGFNNIEFVRGGSSTLFGAGSVAGIINYASKYGSNQSKTMIETEFASPGKVRFDFNTGGAITENSLFYNISGTYRYDEGPIRTGLTSNGYQVRGNIRKVINNGFLTVHFQMIDDKAQFLLPYPLTSNRERPVGWDGNTIYSLQTAAATLLTARTPNGLYQSQAANGAFTKGGYIMVDFQKEFESGWKLNAKIRSAKYQHQFNFFGTDGSGRNPLTQANFLKTITGAVSGTYTYADDNTPVNANALVLQNNMTDRNRPLNEMSTLMTLSKTFKTGNINHNFTMGFFGSRTEAVDFNLQLRFLSEFKDQPRLLNLTTVDANNISTRFTSNGVAAVPGYTNKTITSRKTAFYLSDEMQIGKLKLDAGLRFEKISANGSIEKSATARNADGINVAFGTGAFDRFNVSTSDWALALAASYPITDHINAYANFSKGFFFPELRGLSVRYNNGIPAYPIFKPEKINQYEAGMKFNYSKLTLTAAYFSATLNDRLLVQFLNVGGAIQELSRFISTKSSGFEGTVDYEFAKNLHFISSVTAQKATYTKDETTPTNVGKWVERQPQFMYDAGLYYANKTFDISFSNNYQGKRFGNASNLVSLDPYSIARLTAGYNFSLDSKSSLRVSGGIFNMFNSEGITEGNPRAGDVQTNSGDFFVGRPILPRSYYVRLTFTF